MAEEKEVFLSSVVENNPAVKELGVKSILLKENSDVEIRLDIERKHLNVHNIVHGGIYSLLMDTAMGCACFLNSNMSCVTLNINISFLANCTVGAKTSTLARIVHAGKRVIVAESEIYDENGKIMANAQGAFFVLNS